jgi:hypothetical protein
MGKKIKYLLLPVCLLAVTLYQENLVSEPASTRDALVSCDRVDTLIHEIPSLRELSFVKEVPCRLKNKDDVKQYLDYLLSKEVTSKKLDKEEIIFKALGIIPPDYDYRNGIIKLYKDQVGGYYNPEEKYYAMASWMPASLQDPIAIHELTHALQDQHFDLESIMEESLSSDELIARSALIEGDATLVMTDYSRRLAGLPSINEDESVSSFMLQTIIAASFGGTMKDAPPALQAMLLFPYISGMKFAHALLREGGFTTINHALENPPRGSNEILHPEKYLERINPDPPTSSHETARETAKERLACNPAPSFGDLTFTLSSEDILGEFGTSVFFIAYHKTHMAPLIASRWEDDRICLYSSGSEYYITWEHEWRDSPSREKFINEVKKIFQQRFSIDVIEINNSYELQTQHREVQNLRISSESETKSQISFIVASTQDQINK